MDTAEPDILAAYSVRRHRLTVGDYHRLAEVGLLSAGDRVELLEGQLIDMAPIGPRHALVVGALNDVLSLSVQRSGLHVWPQNPIVLDDGSEPQPDISLIRKPWIGYPATHPHAQDVLLVIEVADTSLTTDIGAKRALYAQAGIPEYWVVDLTTDVVLVHRRPEGLQYAAVTRIDRQGSLNPDALPGIMVSVASILD